MHVHAYIYLKIVLNDSANEAVDVEGKMRNTTQLPGKFFLTMFSGNTTYTGELENH